MRPGRRDIIEKDYHLHRLLRAVSRDEFLAENLAFKGGTCLVKAHLGYFRFSEDVDFTWKDASLWENVPPTATRKRCSRIIDRILDILVPMADELGLGFAGDKTDPDQVIIGGGGRMPRFYLSYRSEVLDVPAKIKMEINFVDRLLYPVRKTELKSYIDGMGPGGTRSDELRFLFREQYDNYTAPITLDCYDPREIFVEKARAALTRVRYRLRDVIDIHMLETRKGYSIPAYSDRIAEKTRFMLELYGKYREVALARSFPSIEDISREEVALLTERPPDDLPENIRRIHGELMAVLERMG
jgi:predicted nucleotidyltransferase component of viral defense system